MSKKTKVWIVTIWIAFGIILFLFIICKPSSSPDLRLGDTVIFITHVDGQTEIMLECVNLSGFHAYGIEAIVAIRYMETKRLVDLVSAKVGDVGPYETKGFSAWTDKVEFGDDVGVCASFTYAGVK